MSEIYLKSHTTWTILSQYHFELFSLPIFLWNVWVPLFTEKVRLHNDLCTMMIESGASFPSSMPDDVISKHVSTISSVMWYLDRNKDKTSERAKHFAVSCFVFSYPFILPIQWYSKGRGGPSLWVPYKLYGCMCDINKCYHSPHPFVLTFSTCVSMLLMKNVYHIHPNWFIIFLFV